MSRADAVCLVCRQEIEHKKAVKGAKTCGEQCWRDLIIWRAIDRGPRVKEIMR